MTKKTLASLVLGIFMVGLLGAAGAIFAADTKPVIVWHLPSRATTHQIENLFTPYGEVDHVSMVYYNSDRNPAYARIPGSHPHAVAYVYMENASDARESVRALDLKNFMGHIIKVRWAGAPHLAEPWDY